MATKQICMYGVDQRTGVREAEANWCGSLAKYIRDNKAADPDNLDPGEERALRKLKLGESIRAGGGAGVLWELLRTR